MDSEIHSFALIHENVTAWMKLEDRYFVPLTRDNIRVATFMKAESGMVDPPGSGA